VGKTAHLSHVGWNISSRSLAANFAYTRLLLTHRRALKRKILDLENEIWHSLKVFGVKSGASASRLACAS
jgi:transposase